MVEVLNHACSAGRAARAAFIVGAVLVSGCFNAGPSVKQAMTSGAPVPMVASAVPAASATDPKKAAFDLDKPGVGSHVATFQTDLRDFFHGALMRSAKYVPTMTDMLIHEGLPAELAYLPLIESGYRPQAVSPAGAVGPWQFISETGKRYGLRIDALVDERRDPIKSTVAAAQYLKDLHDMFGDWELSLAAYNSGEYRVARIIANTGAPDFWSMRDHGYLPSETSQYVPRFLAAVRIAKAPQDYGFTAPAGMPPFHFETVDVDRQLSLVTAAGLCGVSASELAELNPALRRGITPSGYALRVPTGAAAPLRTALANYVEPVHALRRVARAGRGAPRGTVVAKTDRRRQIAARGVTVPLRTARVCASPLRKRMLTRQASRAATANRVRRREAQSATTVRLARAGTPAKASKASPRGRRRSS
jgi:membrane-bound lytic murein transglycosylase D